MGNQIPGGFCVKESKNNKEFGEIKVNVQQGPVQKSSMDRSRKTINQRKCTMMEEEIIITRLRIHMDKVESRLKDLKREEATIDARIGELVAAKKKEEAIHCLRKKKAIKDMIKDNVNKMTLLDSQIAGIEERVEDLGFASALKQSNQVLERMNQELDLEEVRLAKQLQEEGRMRREELEELLRDEEEDQDIKLQLDAIERDMVQKALSGLGGQGEVKRREHSPELQEEKQQSVLLNN